MSKYSIDRRALLVTGVSTTLLAACSSVIGPPDAGPIFLLKPAMRAAGGGPRVPWQLTVVLPEAPDSLDTARIVLVQPNNQMDFYAAAAWPDRLPFLVQSALVETFEASGRIAAVGRDTEGLKSDYLLQTDIRDFQARYDVADAPPVAVVRIGAKLIAAHGRTIVQSRILHSEVQTTENSVAGAVAALDQALSDTLAQIVGWSLDAPPPPRA
jgi:cholesterol transport system auxiliary component